MKTSSSRELQNFRTSRTERTAKEDLKNNTTLYQELHWKSPQEVWNLRLLTLVCLSLPNILTIESSCLPTKRKIHFLVTLDKIEERKEWDHALKSWSYAEVEKCDLLCEICLFKPFPLPTWVHRIIAIKENKICSFVVVPKKVVLVLRSTHTL